MPHRPLVLGALVANTDSATLSHVQIIESGWTFVSSVLSFMSWPLDNGCLVGCMKAQLLCLKEGRICGVIYTAELPVGWAEQLTWGQKWLRWDSNLGALYHYHRWLVI